MAQIPRDFEAAVAALPRLGIADLPTPLQPLKRLSAHLGGPRIWVKREDCTGPGFGGNKLRKLDYVLHEAIAAGADTLVSGGVVQSNSQRQVAAAAAKLGLDCHLAVYHGRVPSLGTDGETDPGAETDYETSGNMLLNQLFGARLHHVAWTGDRNTAITRLVDDLRARGRRPYFVPYGVSNGLGAAGYASTAVELARQAEAIGLDIKAIVHCSGSAATQAGLTLGAASCLPGTDVVGIDIDAEPERVRADVVAYGHAAADLLGGRFDETRVDVIAGHAGPAYGIPHDATLEAIRLAGRLEAMPLDPVYSGKGLAGLIALIRAGRWDASDTIVFLHTGGEPALFAYRSALKLS